MPGASITLTITLLVIYGSLLAWLAVTRQRPAHMTHRRWLALALATAWLGNLTGLLPRDAHLRTPYDALLPEPLTASALAILSASATLVFFGALLLSYLRSRAVIGWMVGAGLWWLAQLVLSLMASNLLPGQPGWYRTLYETPHSPDWLIVAGWLGGGLLLMLIALSSFYRAALPELANQALFGAVNVPPLVGGIALAASGEYVVMEIGLLLQLLALLGATYSATAYRVLDIRRTVRQATVVGVLTLVMALGAFGVGALALHMDLPTPQRYALVAALALAVAALINPLYSLIARALAGSLSERSASTSQQLRRFSADISGVVDLDELVELTLRTVRALLRARRGEFLLVSHAGKGVLEVEPAPRRGERSPKRGQLAISSPITQRFLRARAPLLQYDLDFSPDFASVPPAERAFFSQTRMSAYAPIVVQNRLIGIVCCGPKISDDPFTAADLEILMTIANQTGVALRSARLISDLRRREAEQKALNRALSAAKEQLEKLDSVKSDFITIASHELRTPLAQIRGYAELMESMNEDGQLDQDQIASMTACISRAADRLEELIAAMLDVSQLDIDAMSLQFSPVRIEVTMRAALEPLVEAVRQRKLMVSARNLRDLPTIMGDEGRLVQAFRNIILNAIKYTPDGGRIDIRGEARENEVIVSISDTGIGIDPSLHSLIFEKFFRAQDPNYHSTGTTKFMGAGPGLGLTIARGVVMAHGGRIWVESPGYDPEKCPGSTFYILLPLTPPDLAHRLGDLQKAVRLSERAGHILQPTPMQTPAAAVESTPPFTSTPN